MSRDELVLVGEGRTAEILAWGEGRVLRLLREGASRARALRELRVLRSIHETGIPSPAVYPADTGDGLVEIDGRLGFVMDRVEGPSMLRELTAKPWRLVRSARTFARLHRAIHASTTDGLPSHRERHHAVIDRIAEDIGHDVAARIHRAVDALPDGSAVCHGDFHPDNILMSDDGPIIIDWGPASSGHPAADVAWTVYLFHYGGYSPGMNRRQRLLLDTLRRLFLYVYLRAYLRKSSITRRDVSSWGPAIAALRLGDGIPEERERLLGILRAHFSAAGPQA
jgi:aminoglycoside phosphotransferase (APT) family kinase protein